MILLKVSLTFDYILMFYIIRNIKNKQFSSEYTSFLPGHAKIQKKENC
jgi:hypothetical protein